MICDLNNLFPEPVFNASPRGPLPKQQEFIDSLLQPNGSKYLAYVGGIGSGKTLIGCIAMISLAVMYPGDYLVCRQFMPELKITTLKTFLEICPKELIAEHRVADGIIRLRSMGGKISNIIFRQLDEPDKLRSLNLNAFYIDEASQTSEAAFTLLQGRLRGPHVRKGFITSNPAGHDWIYQWWVKQDMFKTPETKKLFRLIKAPSTENTHLPPGYVQSMMETWSEDRIQREIMGSFDAFEGQVYSEFRRDVHVVRPFKIPAEWSRIAGADHGFRNPACWLWGAIDYDGNVYVYREYYEREMLIEEIVKGRKKSKSVEKHIQGVLERMKGEKLEGAFIDPSTKRSQGTTGGSDWDTYLEHLPAGFPLIPAQNDVAPGIDRVKSYLKQHPRTNKPKLFIFETCDNLIEEMSKYRYKELRQEQMGKKAEYEEPVKTDDHACDALRYMIMSRPDPAKNLDDIYNKIKKGSLEESLYLDLQKKKKPRKSTDPWENM